MCSKNAKEELADGVTHDVSGDEPQANLAPCGVELLSTVDAVVLVDALVNPDKECCQDGKDSAETSRDCPTECLHPPSSHENECDIGYLQI